MDKNDHLRIKPIKLEPIDNYENVRLNNHIIPYETPCYLQAAADKELDKLLKAQVLEPIEHQIDWCSYSFFIQKNTHSRQEAKTRLVSDLRGG